jgi:hypothetical protein
MLALQAYRMQELLKVMDASTQIAKESLGSQVICGRVRNFVGSP